MASTSPATVDELRATVSSLRAQIVALTSLAPVSEPRTDAATTEVTVLRARIAELEAAVVELKQDRESAQTGMQLSELELASLEELQAQAVERLAAAHDENTRALAALEAANAERAELQLKAAAAAGKSLDDNAEVWQSDFSLCVGVSVAPFSWH